MTTDEDIASAEPLTVHLPDGRRLAWYEFGDPNGLPCLFTPGTPSSGLSGRIYSAVARRTGVRLISVDKPGYGHSDFQRGRRLLDYARDVGVLADHLGLDTFAALGESGGGPHALALARAIPERLTRTVVVAGLGPADERWVREGMRPENRRILALAARAPWLLRIPLGVTARRVKDR